MDESTNTQNPTNGSTTELPNTNVMDVVPPRSIPITVTDSSTSSAEMPSRLEASNSTAPNTQAIDITVPATLPEDGISPTTAPAVEVEPSPITQAEDTAGHSPSSENSPDTVAPGSPMAINKPIEPIKHAAPKAAIIVAIVIGLLLIGVVIFAYTQMQKKTATVQPIKNSQTSGVTPGAIDQTANGLDASLNKTDDAKDFVVSDLADTTLGL